MSTGVSNTGIAVNQDCMTEIVYISYLNPRWYMACVSFMYYILMLSGEERLCSNVVLKAVTQMKVRCALGRAPDESAMCAGAVVLMKVRCAPGPIC